MLVPCFSVSHSPAPHSFSPVLSTSRCKGSRTAVPSAGRGTSSVSARRLRVVWSGTARSSPSRPTTGADQPLGLAQGQAEHGPQGQRRQDRQRRVPGLPAAGGAWRSPPGRDRLVAEPHRQAAALAQAGVVLAPVRDLVLLLGDVVAAVLVQLERQGGHPGIRDGAIPLPRPDLQRRALRDFVAHYNATWLVARHGYRTPNQVRAEQRRLAQCPPANLPLAV